MKNLMKFGFFALIFSMLFLTACEDDDDNDPIITGPRAEITKGTEYENQTFEPGQTIGGIQVTFKKGSYDLNAVQINRNGSKMTSGWDLTDADGNPLNVDANKIILLEEDQKDEAVLNFLIDLSDVESIDNYTWYISDVEGQTDSTQKLTIETKYAGTPVQEYTGYLLSNSAGPAGQGGLDLDTGAETGSSDANAEIADAGIDINQPNDKNWLQKFLGVNGSRIMPLEGSFDFDGVTTKEQISTAFVESQVISGTTDKAEVGDKFIVNNGSKYYLLEVKEVNVTADNNGDYINFNIKK